MKGRIYERRSDLSPDGRHLIYFAMNGHWESESRGAWSAISRAPYLKALALFPKGDCWNGGGLFTSRKTYWLNDGYGHSVLQDTTDVTRDSKFQLSQYFGGECTGVYYPRLLRDGWTLASRVKAARWKEMDVFEKPIGRGWMLRKIAHAQTDSPVGKGCYWDEHELVHASSGKSVLYPNWEWAELDGERLVWAQGGKLCAGRLTDDGVSDEHELFDFNGMAFEPIAAPY